MLLRCARLLTASAAAAAFLYGFVAVAADALHSEATTAATTTTTTSGIRGGAQQPPNQPRGLVTGGTPTGGGKYPFLVIVDWDGNVTDPRVSDQLDFLSSSRYAPATFRKASLRGH
jgi:hypothetical protein